MGSTAILTSTYHGVEFRHLRDNPMNPAEFQDKWRRAELTERSAAQQHFLDLCELLDDPPSRRAIR